MIKKIVVYIITLAFTFTILLTSCANNTTPLKKSKTIPLKKITAIDNKAIESKLYNYMKDYSIKKGFSGTILVAKDNKLLLNKGYGMADYNKHIINKPQTVFEIASLTKQFTATAILMLQEQKLLSVQDTINKYISHYPNGNKIKIFNLLTHTSGMPIGTKFKYSSLNYILLGHIIEKVSGMKYEDYIKKNIFKPLKLNATGFISKQVTIKDKAIGYSMINVKLNEYKKARVTNDSLQYSAGGIYSTVQDLYIWNNALFTEKLIKKESLNEMITPYLNNYGFGWFIKKSSDGSKIVFHGGNITGYSSVIERNINKKYVVIILSNKFKANKDINYIASRLLKILDIKYISGNTVDN